MRNVVSRRLFVCPPAHDISAIVTGRASRNMDLETLRNLTPAVRPSGVNGVAHSAHKPVSGAVVQLWQVGTTGYGIGATALGTCATTVEGQFSAFCATSASLPSSPLTGANEWTMSRGGFSSELVSVILDMTAPVVSVTSPGERCHGDRVVRRGRRSCKCSR